MKNQYLHELAKEILAHSHAPITKVRFAKIIYFVYKALILDQRVNNEQIAFIRMPLGPVADGFMDLSKDPEIKVETDSIGLLYNREKYTLKDQSNSLIAPNDRMTKILSQLKNISTSALVEISHLEPSWKNNTNGQKYYITQEDLLMALPMDSDIQKLDEAMDNQLIQSKLVSGMIEEIVADSSALEHPEHYAN